MVNTGLLLSKLTGQQWNNDVKLNAPSEVKFTLEQVQAFVERIEIPMELILADKGLVNEFPRLEKFAEEIANVRITRLEGEHHLHMSQQCEKVADVFNRYFSS